MEAPAVQRAMHLGKTNAQARYARWSARKWHIAQCALAAGVSWFIASVLLGHESPVFAPIAAVVSLGVTYGQRLRRVAEVTAGVAVGVLIADIIVSFLGNGTWQLVVVVALALSVACVLFDFGAIYVNQAAVQSIFVAVLVTGEGTALIRWTDALIGGAVALLAATIAPTAPLRRPREQVAVVIHRISDLLRASSQVMVEGQGERGYTILAQARATDKLVTELQRAADEGLSVVASSPFRLSHKPHITRVAGIIEPLDRALRTTRVLVRQAAITNRHGLHVPASYVQLTANLADATETLADGFADDHFGENARDALIAVGTATNTVERTTVLSAEVILMQLRSLIADLLVLTGMDQFQAADSLPPPPQETNGFSDKRR